MVAKLPAVSFSRCRVKCTTILLLLVVQITDSLSAAVCGNHNTTNASTWSPALTAAIGSFNGESYRVQFSQSCFNPEEAFNYGLRIDLENCARSVDCEMIVIGDDLVEISECNSSLPLVVLTVNSITTSMSCERTNFTILILSAQFPGKFQIEMLSGYFSLIMVIGNCESLDVEVISSEDIEQCQFNRSTCSNYCENPDMFLVEADMGHEINGESVNRERADRETIPFQNFTNAEKLQDFCECSRVTKLDCREPENLENCTTFCQQSYKYTRLFISL